MSLKFTIKSVNNIATVDYWVKPEFFEHIKKSPEEFRQMIADPNRLELKEVHEIMYENNPFCVIKFLHRTDGPALVIKNNPDYIPEDQDNYFLNGDLLNPTSEEVKKIKANQKVNEQVNHYIFDKE